MTNKVIILKHGYKTHVFYTNHNVYSFHTELKFAYKYETLHADLNAIMHGGTYSIIVPKSAEIEDQLKEIHDELLLSDKNGMNNCHEVQLTTPRVTTLFESYLKPDKLIRPPAKTLFKKTNSGDTDRHVTVQHDELNDTYHFRNL
jgi:hypothetical protein